jgi:hypothetical protein
MDPSNPISDVLLCRLHVHKQSNLPVSHIFNIFVNFAQACGLNIALLTPQAIDTDDNHDVIMTM